jgi:hypothetical protein
MFLEQSHLSSTNHKPGFKALIPIKHMFYKIPCKNYFVLSCYWRVIIEFVNRDHYNRGYLSLLDMINALLVYKNKCEGITKMLPQM